MIQTPSTDPKRRETSKLGEIRSVVVSHETVHDVDQLVLGLPCCGMLCCAMGATNNTSLLSTLHFISLLLPAPHWLASASGPCPSRLHCRASRSAPCGSAGWQHVCGVECHVASWAAKPVKKRGIGRGFSRTHLMQRCAVAHQANSHTMQHLQPISSAGWLVLACCLPWWQHNTVHSAYWSNRAPNAPPASTPWLPAAPAAPAGAPRAACRTTGSGSGSQAR